MAYSSFEELDVWQRGTKVAIRVYDVLKGCRDYGLRDQMTRAAVSISSNIAEGAERDSRKEFVRYLHIAKGSAAELRTQVHIAHAVQLITSQQHGEIKEELVIISRKLHKLIESLNKRTSQPKQTT